MSKNIGLIELENKLKELTSKVGSLQGQFSLLNEQCVTSVQKIEQSDHKKELYRKAVELLIIVEKSTKETLKKGFEEIVTYALTYILNDDRYGLKLRFGRRGNLQEVYFDTLTPKCEEAHKPGGFVSDILGLTLRISLMELTRPKIEGFLVLDEPFKAIDSSGNLERAGSFLKAINRRINRQLIVISHKKEMMINADKTIEIK